MKRSRAAFPLKLEWRGEAFLISARFMILPSRRSGPAAERIRRAALAGMRRVWTSSFPLDEGLLRAARAYLARFYPEELPSFARCLEKSRKEAEKTAIESGIAALKSALLALGRKEEPPQLPEHLPLPEPRLKLRLQYSEAPRSRCPLLRFFRGLLFGERRFMLLMIRPQRYLPANVGSSVFRRGWGFFRDFHLISMGFNWSPAFPGIMHLPDSLPEQRAGRVAAHELGHALGLGDAYAAWYRSYVPAEGTEHYLMHSNGPLSCEEFRRVLEAQLSGRLSHFPYRWSLSRFRQGFREESLAMARRIQDSAQGKAENSGKKRGKAKR